MFTQPCWFRAGRRYLLIMGKSRDSNITNIPNSIITGGVDAQSTLWHSYTDDHRGELISETLSNSIHMTLNTDTPTRVPNNAHQRQASPGVTAMSSSLYNRAAWRTVHALNSDTCTAEQTVICQLREGRLGQIHTGHRRRLHRTTTTDRHT